MFLIKGKECAAPGRDAAEQKEQLSLRVAREKAKLREGEKLLGDVLRECEKPVVVPELLELAGRLWWCNSYHNSG